ncbi:MAG TPA: AIR synthase-related protein [Patescibacteria group bacterium]|nr:AIR synthase-related protein [Patescibacteria group bacterium]
MSIYEKAGVSLNAGDEFSAYAAKICKESWGNSPYVEVIDGTREHFRGPRGFVFQYLPEGCFMVGAPDGAGTKTILVNQALSHHTAACDVMAMTCGDITRHGGLPLVFFNVLDVASIGQPQTIRFNLFRKAIVGLGLAAVNERVVLLGGETAELGVCVGSEDPEATTKFNWAGFAIGVNHPDKLITGEKLRPGQIVVALREQGFRSNGISAVREALRQRFGKEWWKVREAKPHIKAAAQPSVLYDHFLTTANGWYKLPRIEAVLASHITGGGIVGKFFRDCLEPHWIGANLHALWEPPTIMRQCAQWSGMSDQEAYRVWNGGQGVLVVLEPGDVERFIALAKTFDIQAKVCGTITADPTLVINSKFTTGTVLEYGA